MRNTSQYIPPSTKRIDDAIEAVKFKSKLKALEGLKEDVLMALASKITGLPPDMITTEMRRRAKKAAYAWAFGAEEELLRRIMAGQRVHLSDVHPSLDDTLA